MSKPSIIIAGDMCLWGRTASFSANQLKPLLQEIRPLMASVAASLVNLETAVVRQKYPAISKAGPAIKTDTRILDVIKETGFTGVTLANNHFADYGQEGVEESLDLLDQYGLWHVGAGMNQVQAARVGYITVGSLTVAVINACEHEFTVATETKAGCNALNPIQLYHQIQNAKLNADKVIIIVHGGHEHYNLPSPRMQEMYRFFIEVGADAVINHHQHCYSGYEMYQGKPIVYGLGNFFFDWQGHDDSWNDGYMVRLTFDEQVQLELIPYIQNKGELGVRLLSGKAKVEFCNRILMLNETIADIEKLQSALENWSTKKSGEYMRMLCPTVYRGGASRENGQPHIIQRTV